MSEDGAIVGGDDACQSANPMTKQVSAEAREAAEKVWHIFHPQKRSWVEKQIQSAIDKSRATLPSAGDGKDSERLDWLEDAMWNHPNAGNGIAVFPFIFSATGEKGVNLQGLGDEDGSNLGDEITPSCATLRAAIDAARGESSPPPPQPAAEEETRTLPPLSLAPLNIHPDTLELIRTFAESVLHKLAAAEKKYGYSNEWSGDWEEVCQQHLIEHVAKGDPRDVAAYCAFMWSHGWSTAPGLKKYVASSRAREADLTAALRDVISAAQEVLNNAHHEVRYGAGDLNDAINRGVAILAIKPASALTATKEEGQ